jgi:hypothetical protein
MSVNCIPYKIHKTRTSFKKFGWLVTPMPCGLAGGHHMTLKMEVIYLSEMLVFETTWHHKPEDHQL